MITIKKTLSKGVRDRNDKQREMLSLQQFRKTGHKVKDAFVTSNEEKDRGLEGRTYVGFMHFVKREDGSWVCRTCSPAYMSKNLPALEKLVYNKLVQSGDMPSDDPGTRKPMKKSKLFK